MIAHTPSIVPSSTECKPNNLRDKLFFPSRCRERTTTRCLVSALSFCRESTHRYVIYFYTRKRAILPRESKCKELFILRERRSRTPRECVRENNERGFFRSLSEIIFFGQNFVFVGTTKISEERREIFFLPHA